MTPETRITQALRKGPVDRTPAGELCIDDALVQEFCGKGETGFSQRLAFVTHLGLDLICLPTHYGTGGGGRGLPGPAGVVWPDLARWSRESGLFTMVLLDGAFSWGVKTMGFKDFLMAMQRRSPDVPALYREVNRLNKGLVRRAADAGAHGIVIADDIAYQRGLLVAPEVLRKDFFPDLGRLAATCRESGLVTFFHSDGNLAGVLDDIAHSGVDGLQCIESAAGMDLEAVKVSHGDRLCLWGNLDPDTLVKPMDEETLEGRVEAVLKAGGAGGNYIFGTSSGLFNGMRIENILRVYSHVRRLGGERPLP